MVHFRGSATALNMESIELIELMKQSDTLFVILYMYDQTILLIDIYSQDLGHI